MNEPRWGPLTDSWVLCLAVEDLGVSLTISSFIFSTADLYHQVQHVKNHPNIRDESEPCDCSVGLVREGTRQI